MYHITLKHLSFFQAKLYGGNGSKLLHTLKDGSGMGTAVRHRGQHQAEFIHHTLRQETPVHCSAAAYQHFFNAKEGFQLLRSHFAIQSIRPGEDVRNALPSQISPVRQRRGFRQNLNDMGIRPTRSLISSGFPGDFPEGIQ